MRAGSVCPQGVPLASRAAPYPWSAAARGTFPHRCTRITGIRLAKESQDALALAEAPANNERPGGVAPESMNPGRMAPRAKGSALGGVLALALAAGEAWAQSTDTNVVTASADAFGVAIGVEALGVYGPSQVRGFDPLAAGNARIEGLYADVRGQTIPYGPLPARLVQNTRIRVGPAAAGFP